ncbi:MAG TPA: hypothetical protein VNO55_23960 [Polyangia bacterium]|nr:hypothetical protein [Polyangia bacterium]
MHHSREHSLDESTFGGRAIEVTPTARAALVATARPFLAALCCLGATVALLLFLHRLTPVQTWLPAKLACLWLWLGVFVAGCLGLGNSICRWALRGTVQLPALERLVLMSATGVGAFALLMDVAGALHLFHPGLAVALPALGVAAGVGARPAQTLSAVLARLRGWRWRGDLIDVLVVGVGALGVSLVYLHVLDPAAPNYDAHWTHLPIAQDFARAGRLVPFLADWAKNFPHLTSLIDTWIWLLPGLPAALRLPLVMHTEFAFFVGTLAAVLATVRWLLRAREGRHGVAWAAFFLFPSIFVYDSNLGGSADHLAAFMVLPLFLALARAGADFSPRLCAVGGALAGAALITKYQTVYVSGPLAAWLVVRAIRVLVTPTAEAGRQRRRTLVGLGALGAGAVLAASPYFLENVVFHGNPVYPFMQGLFTRSRPTFADVPFLVSTTLTPADLRGAGHGLVARLASALRLIFTFSFQPHYSFIGARPYFGFLFTLLAPLTLLVPDGRRLRMAALVAGGALFCWALNYLVDRNLQIVLPLLVTVTAGVIIRLWHLGWAARIGLIPLCLVQVFWGGDLFFQGALQGTIDQIRGHLTTPVDIHETSERQAITRELPAGAKVIIHDEHSVLGLDREALSDQAGFQGLIDYHPLRTAREVFDRFSALGVTHLLWIESAPAQLPIQREILFGALVHPLAFSAHGRYKVAALPATPPPATPPYRVLTVGLSPLPDGVYPIDELSRCEMRPPGCTPPAPTTSVPGPDVSSALLRDGVDVVLLRPGVALEPPAAAALADTFSLVRSVDAYQLFLRKP